MEVTGLARLIDHLKNCPEIVGYVHDNDAKTRKLIKLSDWEIAEYLDPGHAMKSFDRILQKKQYESLIPLRESLRSFMFYLLKGIQSGDDGIKPFSIDEKLKHWQNVLNHYRGDHSQCPIHHDDSCMKWEPLRNLSTSNEASSILGSFVAETKWILEKCDGRYSTQANESINRIKVTYANKDVKWWVTYVARMACAVLDRNMPFWKITLREKLGLVQLSPYVRTQMINYEEERLKRQARGSVGTRKALHVRFSRARKRIEKEPKESDDAKPLYRGSPYAARTKRENKRTSLLFKPVPHKPIIALPASIV
jgi:hypothetical protein